MPVEERVRGLGRFAVNLQADTPYDVLRHFIHGPDDDGTGPYLGHVLVTGVELPPTLLGAASVLAASEYTGVVRWWNPVLGQRYTISGSGLAYWLGDDSGKGKVIETAIAHDGTASGTLADWVADLLPPSLALGTVTAPTGNPKLSQEFIYLTRREALDNVVNAISELSGDPCDWRITPQGELDVGPTDILWVSHSGPFVYISRKEGGDAPNIQVPLNVDFGLSEDIDDYATRALVIGAAFGFDVAIGEANLPVATPYLDLFGNAAELTVMVDEPRVEEDIVDDYAASVLTKVSGRHRSLEVTTDSYDIRGDAEAGDAVYVWAPELGVYDLGPQAFTPSKGWFRGEFVAPAVLQIVAFEWPLQRGMGVYYRDRDGQIVNLTPYVVWESQPTRYELGSASRADLVR